MAARCRATKRDGTPCTLPSTGPNGLCWAHDPKNAERRRRGQSRGGKAKASAEIRDLKKQLEDLVEDVRTGRMERGDAVAVNQILNTRARLIELERKVKETEELEARLDALERAAEGQRGGRSWGA